MARSNPDYPTGIDGGAAQEAILGVVTGREFISHNDFLAQAGSTRGRVDSVMAMDRIRKAQPAPTLLARRLKADLSKLLIAPESDYEIEFFTAVGSVIDHGSGVDAWVEISNKHTRSAEAQFKMDLTLNTAKLEPHGTADFAFRIAEGTYLDEINGSLSLNEAYFETPGYKDLLENASKVLRMRMPYRHRLNDLPENTPVVDREVSKKGRRRIVPPPSASVNHSSL